MRKFNTCYYFFSVEMSIIFFVSVSVLFVELEEVDVSTFDEVVDGVSSISNILLLLLLLTDILFSFNGSCNGGA